jgi:PAS domain S-box-containing protein
VVFRVKLLLLTMTGILLVGIIPLVVTGLRRGQLRNEMMEELNTLGRSECAKVANDVYLMLRAQNEKLKKEVQSDLNVAEYIMNEAGGLSLSKDRVHWTATDQLSEKSIGVDLPKALLGDKAIAHNADSAVPSPVVDKVHKLVGARCTIFQRMNDSGDLLRVCTNVLKKDGTRAVGTYIPAVDPDGSPNPVVAAILQGETHVGRAYVVDDWYLTAYEPLFDADRRVIGALFCGVRLEDIPELRKGIVDIAVGRTGYAYVLGGSGRNKGRYIISRRGLRDGENIYDSHDASGKFFIRDIIEKAMQTKNGECCFAEYEWKNTDEDAPRSKIVAATYFEPWDWVIGAGTYKDDFQDAIVRIDHAASRLVFWGMIGAFLAFALCGMLAWVESGRITALKRAEEAIRGSEVKYKTLYDASGDAIMYCSPEGQMLAGNASTIKLFGCKDEKEFVSLNAVDLSPEYQPDGVLSTVKAREVLAIALEQGSSFFEWTHRRVDGTEFPATVLLSRIELEGRPLVLATVRDVTAQKEAERAVRESEQRLANIIDFLPDATFAVARDGKVIAWNRAIEEMTGVPADAILGQGDHAYSIPFYGEPRPALIDLIFNDDEQTKSRYHSLVRNGNQIIAESSTSKLRGMDSADLWIVVSPLYDSDSRIVGAIESVRDITEQRQAQKALEESERRLATIIDFLPDGTFAVDRDGKVIAWNRAIEQMTGVPASEMLGKGDYAYAVPFYGQARPILIDSVIGGLDDPLRQYDSTERKGALLVAERFHPKLRGGKGAYIWSAAAPLFDSERRIVGAIESIRDVTEQKNAENALRASETKYRAVYDASSDGILLRTADRKIVTANRAAVAMFGCKDESELAATPLAELYPERQPDGELSEEKAVRVTDIARREGLHVFEWNYVRKDGTPFYATVALTMINLDGRDYYLTTIRDVTRQKLAEEALRSSETKYRTLYDASSDAILLRTPDRSVAGANAAAVALFGYKDESELKVVMPVELYTEYQPDGRLSVEKAPEMAEIALREGSYSFEWKYRRKDGSEFLANVLWTRMELDGRPTLLTTIRDITEQRRAEEALRASERRYRLLADNLSDVIWAIDFSGHFTYVSPSVARLLGYTVAEIMAKSLDDVLTPEARVTAHARLEEAVAAAQRGQRIVGSLVELEQTRKDGSTVPTDITYSGMYDESGQLVAIQGISRDVTERKLAQANLAAARDEAQAANRAKSRFLATMSHEIRTPMTAILGYADLLMDPMIGPSERNNYVATIRRGGEHLLDLINDILDLSKIEAGKMSLVVEQCQLMSLLADVASVVRPRAEQHGISFSVEYPGAIPESIHTDRARLRQTLVNLAGNAVKFTEKGSVRLVASFLPDGADGQPAVQIDVIDTGIGIAKDVLPQLFRPFSQGDPAITQKFGGTGLGLAISNQLVQMLGGKLSVVSKLGRGSVFTLTLPTGSLDGVPMIENPTEAMLEDREKTWTAESHDLTGVRILLAEDGFDNRELIQTFLGRVGAKVETAVNGCIAVQKAGETPFDLILMDMNMPEMDGYEATRLLRDRGHKGPIVALTANAMVGDSDRCREAGCNEYLTKPIDRRRLIQTVVELVDIKAVAARTGILRKRKRLLGGTSHAVQPKSPAEPSPVQVARSSVAIQETSADQEPVLISAYRDDPELAPIIHQFVKNLGDQLNAMYQTQSNHEHEELRRLAHRLKGAGGSYGYQQLTDASRVLEDAARAHDDEAEIAALGVVAVWIHAAERGCGP